MLKVLHGADFHLDSPFSGLKPDAAARRRGEQRELLARLTDLAREREADLVLLSGDLLDGDLVFRETVQALARALGEIPCPVFLAPGNHDWYGPQSPYAALEWPGNVHLFTGPELGAVRLPELGCTVWGAAFCAPRQSASPLRGFHAPAEGVQLAVLHGEVAAQGDYGPISEEDIAASGLDYLALGHVHQYSGLRRAGETFWAYPGCPEGRGFDELGEKGVLWLEVEKGRTEAEFVPLCRRRYQILSVDLTGQADPAAAVLAALPSVKLTGVTVSTHEMPSGVSSTAEGLSFDGSTALVQNGGSGAGSGGAGAGALPQVLGPDPAGPYPGGPGPVGAEGGGHPHRPVPPGDGGALSGGAGE